MATVLPPITPSVPGRTVEFDQDAPVVFPTLSLLTATGRKSQCSSHALPDGRIAWLISQEDILYPDVTVGDGYVTDTGTPSGSNGESSLWLGFAPNEETFLTENNSVTAVRKLLEVVSHPSVADRTHCDGTLFMVPGDLDHLWMVWRFIRLREDAAPVTYDPDFPDPGVGPTFFGGTFIYRSDDWGETWEHYSTVNTRGADGTSSVVANTAPSYPYFTPDGSKWAIALDSIQPISFGSPRADHVVLSSADAGLTWQNPYDLVTPESEFFADGSGTAGTGKLLSRNLSHSLAEDGSFWAIHVTLSGVDSQNFNELAATDENLIGSGGFVDVDHQVGTDDADYAEFRVRGAQAVVWDDDGDGTAEGLWINAEGDTAPASPIHDRLHYVTAPRSWSYDHDFPDAIVDQFEFTNWPENGRQTFVISPGIDHYLVSCSRFVLGIRAFECTAPHNLHIPHKEWKFGGRPDWYTDNWLAIERWAQLVNTRLSKCTLHIPLKSDPTPVSARKNYNALRTWVDDGCVCCATSKKHHLPVPGLNWTHKHYMLTVERWVDLLIETCADADP
jgi:hypothetical protein